LAVIPILFLWVYLSWVVVLLGAVFTYSITVTCDARDELAEKERNGELSYNDGDASTVSPDNLKHGDAKQTVS
jgi:membrane protein